MRKIIEFFLYYFFKIILSIRYRVTIKGLENLNPSTLNKKGGVLFLPNHPALFCDPTLVTLAVMKKYPIRPLVTEYMYYSPIAYRILNLLGALPVPDMSGTSHSFKKRRSEKMIQDVIDSLAHGENFLIYPAGHLKNESKEIIGGASGAHQIVQSVPEANVVLVRVKGLWGSSFSRAPWGKSPPMGTMILRGIKKALKNFIFFTPKRDVIIEFSKAPENFPYDSTRLEFNKYLEDWYNKPDGLTEQEGKLPGDSLVQVSYSMWGDDFLPMYEKQKDQDATIDLSKVPLEIKNKVLEKVSELTQKEISAIDLHADFSTDLGMDSLDIAELSSFLHDDFNIPSVSVAEITTPKRVMGIAAHLVEVKGLAVDTTDLDLSKWFVEKKERYRVQVPHGKTMMEAFVNCCAREKKSPACSDLRTGVITYDQMLVRVLLLADKIKEYEGKYIGVLLPASCAAYITILAVQMAGKVPVMINWTAGPRHLEAVRDISSPSVVLSAWSFLNKLSNVDLTGVDDRLFMLEDLKFKIGLKDKIFAYLLSKRSTHAILKYFNHLEKTGDEEAVLLFTSGTESLPKGVPLSHNNILENQRSPLEVIEIYNDDSLLGILPPFHSFGFNISGLMGILSGVKTAFSPDPTDGAQVAKAVNKWKTSIICGAPTFIQIMLKAAEEGELESLRMVTTGAEAAPKELFEQLAKIGKEQCIIEGYGITECSPVLTVNRSGKSKKGVGEPIPGVDISIVNVETRDPVEVGQEGLILARGPSVFKKYLGKTSKSPFLQVAGKEWYNTGDLGYFDDEGRLTISGRLKRFIKIGAEMVSLPAVENALVEVAKEKKWAPDFEEPVLAIVGKESHEVGPQIHFFSTFDTSVESVNQELKRSGFSNLIKINSVQKVNEIPIMGSGKIHYRKLEEQYLG